MGCLTINGEDYIKLGNLVIDKYEYQLLIKGNSIYYVILEDGEYRLPNPDLTLKGNASVPLSNLNSRIMIDHIKDVIENDIKLGLIKNNETLKDVLVKIQNILNSDELYPYIMGGFNEVYHFDEEVVKMKELFDELHNDITGLIPRKLIEKKKKRSFVVKPNEAANIDTIMLVMIANIAVLIIIMALLMIIK